MPFLVAYAPAGRPAAHQGHGESGGCPGSAPARGKCASWSGSTQGAAAASSDRSPVHGDAALAGQARRELVAGYGSARSDIRRTAAVVTVGELLEAYLGSAQYHLALGQPLRHLALRRRHHADPPDQPRLPPRRQQPRHLLPARRLRRRQGHRRRDLRTRRRDGSNDRMSTPRDTLNLKPRPHPADGALPRTATLTSNDAQHLRAHSRAAWRARGRFGPCFGP